MKAELYWREILSDPTRDLIIFDAKRLASGNTRWMEMGCKGALGKAYPLMIHDSSQRMTHDAVL